MNQITIIHNPFLSDTDNYINCYINDKNYNKTPDIEEFFKRSDINNQVLKDWIADLLQTLKQILNDGEMEISFIGLPYDFECLKQVTDELNNQSGWLISVNYGGSKESQKSIDERSKDLHAIFKELKEESPFENLNKADLEKIVNSLGSEEEIGIVATMSAGKSTLLNALMHNNILPSANQATTANIAKIYNDKNQDEFIVFAKDKNGELIYNEAKATKEIVKELNQNSNVSEYKIRGNLENLNNYSLNLVICDTPGPNNSQDDSHEKHTLELINDANKPMLLYIMNAHQLGVKDDKYLLEKIAEKLEENQLTQSKDRFIFVLNKIDSFDPENGESVEDFLQNAKKYLESLKIPNPRIFPISAEAARLARMSKKGMSLGFNDDEKRSSFIRRIQREEYHLSNFAPLSKNDKAIQDEKIKQAKQNNDNLTLLDIYSGVPALEMAINEYMEKHAVRARISRTVGNLLDFIKKQAFISKSRDALLKDQGRIEIKREDIKKIKERIKEANAGIDKYYEFEEFDLEGSINKTIAKAKEDFSIIIQRHFKKENTPNSQEECLMMANKIAVGLEAEAKKMRKNLKNTIKTNLLDKANKMIEEYKNQIKNIIKNDDVLSYAFDLEEMLPNQLLSDSINFNNTASKYKGEKTVEESYRVKNYDKAWYKPWTWFDEEYETRYRTVTKETFESEAFMADIHDMLEQNASKEFQKLKEASKEEGDQIKLKLQNSIKRLDESIKSRLQEEEELIKDIHTLEKQVKKNKENLEWIENKQQKIKDILKIG